MYFSKNCRHLLSIVACQNAAQNVGILSVLVSPAQLSSPWCSGLVSLCASLVVVAAGMRICKVTRSTSCFMIPCCAVVCVVWLGDGSGSTCGGCCGIV